ncbi:MAG TPA: DsbA family protein [Candidimonas sp.]|nr:DsbA family protein [Candidimonas sp.]
MDATSAKASEQAFWFFDLVSPFSYLHYHKLKPLRDRINIQPVPVLFAGLLKHWETKGPAEVPSKRLHTYQYCVWAARQQGLAFKMPPRHPFNPLAAQRLLVALNATDPVVEAAFHFVYGEGRDPEYELVALADQLKVTNVGERTAEAEVKQQLVSNTQSAIDQGVFGVPTLVFRNRLFWGSDTVDWAQQFLNQPDMFQQHEYEAVTSTEFGIARK